MSMKSALSKLGNVTPATREKAEEVWAYMASKGVELKRLWGMGPGDEHGVGRAIDFMIVGVAGPDIDAGYLISNYLWKNRKRLQLKWQIWDDAIQSTSPGKSGKREPYRGKSRHRDHVHAFFGTGGYVPPASGGGGGSAKVVDLSKVREAAREDPDRRQGGTTPGAAASVKIVEDALRREGLLSARYSSDGSFGSLTVKAYSKWQLELYPNASTKPGGDADGIPGRDSLTRLGRKRGFSVKS